MSTPRFHAPVPLEPGATITLARDESHHAAHVMRLGPGALLRVFDGSGREAVGRVATIGRTSVTVQLDGLVDPARESGVGLQLAQAVLRGDRMDEVIRDAVMMGVTTIEPLVTANATLSGAVRSQERLADRWRRVALASTKQCGRAVLTAVSPPSGFDHWLAGTLPPVRLLLLEPGRGDNPVIDLAELAGPARRGGAVIAVGPEGGWSPSEVARAVEHGFRPWTLGARTLRADAMAVAALAVLSYLWDRDPLTRMTP